jgi:hypothetical protein
MIETPRPFSRGAKPLKRCARLGSLFCDSRAIQHPVDDKAIDAGISRPPTSQSIANAYLMVRELNEISHYTRVREAGPPWHLLQC